MNLYDGKIVLVTGTSRGIGLFIAEYFINKGASVIGFSRSEGKIINPNYEHICVDIGDIQQIESAFKQIKSKYTHINYLINNAGFSVSQHSLLIAAQAAINMVNANFLGPFFVTKETVKLMMKTKNARIINIGSMASKTEPSGASVYSACKSAMITLSHIFAKEYSQYSITCNNLAVSITALKTEMQDQLTEEIANNYTNSLVIPRRAELNDIFNVIDFFVSEKSSYITAQTIYLGGIAN
ncbi:MAG: SDR family oxidoreductase [bacterium]